MRFWSVISQHPWWCNVKMYKATLILLAALVAVVLGAGQYYVPRSYYTIDETGHASAPIPLRRLRRSIYPTPLSIDSSAGAHANVDPNGNANAGAYANNGRQGSNPPSWSLPNGGYGASKPLRSGETLRHAGPVEGARGVFTSSSVSLDSTGKGYYDQTASVSE